MQRASHWVVDHNGHSMMQEGPGVQAPHNFGEEIQLEDHADHDNPTTAAADHIALYQK